MCEQKEDTRGRIPAETEGLSRREFVARGSATLAAPLLLGSASLLDAQVEVVRGRMAVGYLRGSESLIDNSEFMRSLDKPEAPIVNAFFHHRNRLAIVEPAEVVAADSLSHGEEDLLHRPPVVWIHGILPPAIWISGETLLSVAVEVVFPVVDASLPLVRERSFVETGEKIEPTPYLAWRYDSWPVSSGGSPTAFPVPISEERGLQISVDVARAAKQHGGPAGSKTASNGATRTRLTTEISVGRFGRPKLRRGVYFLGLDPAARERLPIPATYNYLVPNDMPWLVLSVHESLDSLA